MTQPGRQALYINTVSIDGGVKNRDMQHDPVISTEGRNPAFAQDFSPRLSGASK